MIHQCAVVWMKCKTASYSIEFDDPGVVKYDRSVWNLFLTKIFHNLCVYWYGSTCPIALKNCACSHIVRSIWNLSYIKMYHNICVYCYCSICTIALTNCACSHIVQWRFCLQTFKAILAFKDAIYWLRNCI